MKQTRNNSTILLAIFACLLWSTAFVGVKFGLQFFKPLAFAGSRFFLAGLIILPFCLGQLKPHMRRTGFYRIFLKVGLFQTFLLYGFFYMGMTLVSGALAAIIIGSSPLVAALTAHVMMHDDKITFTKLASIALGILGIAVISLSRQPWTAAGLTEFIGIVLLLLSSFVSALGNVLVSKDSGNFHALTLNSFQLMAGGVMLFLVSLFVEGRPQWPREPRFYLAFSWLVFLSATAFSIWFILLKRPGVKVSELNIWKFIIPVFGAAFSWLLLPSEEPEIWSVTGMGCVTLSILFFYRSKRT
ncbi:DMT family transporter [bacterium]|nr:DMT family transporter [bacterium]